MEQSRKLCEEAPTPRNVENNVKPPVVLHGKPQLEHWDALHVLKFNLNLLSSLIDNSKNPDVRSHQMALDHKAFYKVKPRMRGEYNSGRGFLNNRWRWNQSNGQVIIFLDLSLPDGFPSGKCYVRMLKYNNRSVSPHENVYTLTRRFSQMHKAWIMELYDCNKESIGVFYWCAKGYPSSSLHPSSIVNAPLPKDLSVDYVKKLIDELPQFNPDDSMEFCTDV